MPNNDVFEPHPIVRLLEKPAADFTCSDLVRAVEQLELRQVNLRYVGGDGRLKTVAFPINSREHLIEVLTRGERVDGSSIFQGTETHASDVYIVPRHRTAFLNPFGERPSLRRLVLLLRRRTASPCRTRVARSFAGPPRCSSRRRGRSLRCSESSSTTSSTWPADDQVRGAAWLPGVGALLQGEHMREEVLGHLSAMGIKLKYAHGEVGNILEEDWESVQHEIEFWPAPVEQAADALVVAKWVVREVAYGHGLEVDLCPLGQQRRAGSGLHVHSRLVCDGANAIMGKEGINDTGQVLVDRRLPVGGQRPDCLRQHRADLRPALR